MKLSSRTAPKYHRPVSPLRPIHAVLLFLSALAVRIMWVPNWERLVFDGHESLYRDAFLGKSVGASTQAYPLLTFLYGGLGTLSQDPRILVLFSAVVGSFAVVGTAVWIGRWIEPKAGVWAGVLVCVLPEHAAWSTSAYNVVLPHALIVWAFALGGRHAMLLTSIAATLRIEIALLTPWLGWKGVVGGLIGAGGSLSFGLELPVGLGDSLAFDFNWPMLRYLGPPVLFLSLLGLGRGKRWWLLAIAIWVHVVGSAFDDYGARHALLGGVALCGLVASARSVWVPLIVVAGLGWDTFELADDWYAPDRGEIAAKSVDLPAPPKKCVEVSEEPVLVGQKLPSHIRFYRGEIDADCVIWGEEFWHNQWSSRGLKDRAERMRLLYTLEPIGTFKPAGGGPVRLYHRLERRW
jgi:hypothetical protein